MSIVARLIYLATRPSRHPIRKVTLYYLIVFAVVFAIGRIAPQWTAWLTDWESASIGVQDELGDVLSDRPFDSASANAISVSQLLYTLSSVLSLMIPISWGYMSTRMKAGFDQSVVQTMLILPIAVAGIVVVVQNSIALAFSLAGIVAAVRFRNTLSDTADALYIFMAIGVGLACGIGSVDVAIVVSVFFNYVVLTLWHCDYGVCFKAGPLAEYSSGYLLERVDDPEARFESNAGGKKRKKKRKKRARNRAREAAAAATTVAKNAPDPAPSTTSPAPPESPRRPTTE